MTDPKNFTVRCAIALIIVLTLFASVYVTSQNIIKRTAYLAEVATASSNQLASANEILLIASTGADQMTDGAPDMPGLVRQFAAVHQSLMQGDLWSQELESLFFSGNEPLNSVIWQFIDLAIEYSDAPPQEQPQIADRLRDFYGESGMLGRMDLADDTFQDHAQAEITRLGGILGANLIVAALVMTAILLFVVVPTQAELRHTVRALSDKTRSLLTSQEEERKATARLQEMVNRDMLTGLPNRASMIQQLTEISKDSHALELGTLFVGLDQFKTINDTMGCELADQLLIEVASRLLLCVDEVEQIARIGGDEFFLLTTEPIDALAKRVSASFDDSFEIDGRAITVKASIGSLRTEVGSMCPDQIIRNAGLAMQAAKMAGGNRIVPFSKELREGVVTLRQLQHELRDAISTGQIEPWFQPQINLSDGTLHGVEVLARWRHPTRGILTPDKFFPAAEHAGLTIELDHAIWRSAIEFAARWQSEGSWHPVISLNAAPATIADPFLIERLLKTMHKTQLDLDQIVIEVLETTLIEGADDMAAINIDSLAECGIALELDDFGTGYASLSKLTQLPLAGIKLDRSLIAPLPDMGADSVLRAILALATELGLQVVAEGIEEAEQADHLTARGCAIGQGYGFARPMSGLDFDRWLLSNAKTKISAVNSSTPVQMRA